MDELKSLIKKDYNKKKEMVEECFRTLRIGFRNILWGDHRRDIFLEVLYLHVCIHISCKPI